MIQRIQTVWLLLAALCIFLTMQFSTYVGAHEDSVIHLLKGTENSLIVIITSMVGVVSLISIFFFKNRKLQLRIVLIALFLEFILAFLYYKEIAKLVSGTFSIAALLHIGVVVFLLLALRGITSDDKLIKDSSRLR
jgi:uncharacterized membrane protein